MQPFDLPQAQLAVQHARLAAWQLDQGLRLFRERGNPRASILGILVELNYLERDLALRLRQAEAPSYDPSRSALAHSQAPHPHSVTGSRAPEVKGSRAPGLAPPPIAPPPKTSHDDAPTMPLDGSGYQARGLRSSDSTAPSRAASLTGRERFGRYELRGTVAKGGMGTVYRAFLPELDKIVAIKTLSNDRDPVDRQRFLQEARAAAKLRHPNIVSVHDIGVEQGIDYFTMDLIEGDSLDEIVHKRGRFTPTEAAQLCVKLARALDYAHDLGVVHRDIKPGNVIVEQRTGEPFLTDFGLARQIESSTQLTKTGFAVGTPNYMAPEQATGQKDVDRRADVYGIGTLLYAIIVGEPPFDGPNALATMTSVINDPAPSLKAHERSTPLALDAVCQRAMAKEREDRFATAGELADAIEAALKTPDPPPRSSSPLIVAVLGVLILAMGAAALGHVRARWRRAQAFSDAAAAAGELADAGELAAARERLEEARGLSPDDPEVGRLDDRLTRLERRRDEALAAEAAARARAEAQQRAEELLAEARAEAARGEFRSALRRSCALRSGS